MDIFGTIIHFGKIPSDINKNTMKNLLYDNFNNYVKEVKPFYDKNNIMFNVNYDTFKEMVECLLDVWFCDDLVANRHFIYLISNEGELDNFFEHLILTFCVDPSNE
jgi:hypothetical protein